MSSPASQISGFINSWEDGSLARVSALSDSGIPNRYLDGTRFNGIGCCEVHCLNKPTIFPGEESWLFCQLTVHVFCPLIKLGESVFDVKDCQPANNI